MSNNAPDYEDNLVFPPQEIKSQDDIKHQDARSSDVLIKAVEKCEKLEKQLKIAKKGLTEIKIYGDGNRDCDIAAKYLKQIKELDK
jgi:hypothetical protein